MESWRFLPVFGRNGEIYGGNYTPKSGQLIALIQVFTFAGSTIYLSGGHRSGWQDFIVRSAGRFEFIDPSKNGLSDSKAYTSWDLYSIDKCDIVFAYFESTNPSGYGLALEVGYAAAKGKHVIFVDEKSESDQNLSKYIKIIREASDAVFESIDEGVNYLKSLP